MTEKWILDGDEDGEFVRFEGKGDVDAAFTVYLPDKDRDGAERDRAKQVIVDALNAADVVVNWEAV